MGWRLRLSDKTVRKLAELPIYCHRQKCSPGNVVSDSIRFMQIFAGVHWGGASSESAVDENGDFRLHSFTVFLTFYIHGHTTAFRWYGFRLVPLLMTLKYIWRSFQPRMSFHVHFSNPWHAFASHGLPAIAELLVYLWTKNGSSTVRKLYLSLLFLLLWACQFPNNFVHNWL